jgi:magnesium transporter
VKQRTYRITEDKWLKAYSGEAEPTSPTLTILHRDDAAELRNFFTTRGVPAIAICACLDSPKTTRISTYDEWLLITMSLRCTWNDQGQGTATFLAEGEQLIVLSDSFDVFEELLSRYTSGMRFHEATISAVLYQILNFIVDQNMAFAIRLREEVQCVERLAESDDVKFAAEAADLKRILTSHTATFENQLYYLRSLQTTETSAVSTEGLHDYYRDTIADLDYAIRSLERQESRLATAHQEVQIRQQARTNDQLQTLTILSTIFLPLTLITGIYGMNFRHMPELNWTYGYAVVLIVMLVLTGGMLWGFYRSKWLK